jgi:putative aminopeptidase FrvX
MSARYKEQLLELLRELTETPGISGYEDLIREKIRSKIVSYGEPKEDSIGNLFISIGRGASHILFAAHMDELGFVVSQIDKEGGLRFRIIGSLLPQVLVGRAVWIYTSKGRIPGVIGIKPPHLMRGQEERKEVIKEEELRIDLGVKSEEQAVQLGVKPLDFGVVQNQFNILCSDIVSGRSLDNRVGCAILIIALRELNLDVGPRNRVTFAWTVQEEVGLRGARALAHQLEKGVAFPIDTVTCADFPGVESYLSPSCLGEGPVLRMIDRKIIASRWLGEWVREIASKNKIPFQMNVAMGGTDAAAIQEVGAKVLALTVPARYTHSPVEMIHLDDAINLLKLILAITREEFPKE